MSTKKNHWISDHASMPTAPCHLCTGKCCTYFALELDHPKTMDDFDNIFWYLLHQKTFVFVEEGTWFLQVQNVCQFLEKDYRCGIYDERPAICREYGFDEDHRVLCDKTTEEEAHEMEFHHPKQLKAYLRKRFPRSKKYREDRS